MSEQVTLPPDVVATGISAEDFMIQYADGHYEWVDGKVIQMAPVTSQHDEVFQYLIMYFRHYLLQSKIGRLKVDPFVMSLPNIPSRRQPDLQFIANDNPGQLTATYMHGPADICIEIVSEESYQRDHSTKLLEYEKGGVQEYWIIDPQRHEARFFRLNDEGNYAAHKEDANGNYRTPLLPKYVLHVPSLWLDPLPDLDYIMNAINAMFDTPPSE